MPHSGSITLSDVDDPYVTIVCDRCKRSGRYSVPRLRLKHGDARLPDLLNLLSTDCPKRMANKIADTCKAKFEWPNGPPRAPEG